MGTALSTAVAERVTELTPAEESAACVAWVERLGGHSGHCDAEATALFAASARFCLDLPVQTATRERIQCLLEIVAHYYMAATPHAALAPAAAAAQCARQLGELPLIRRSLNVAGLMQLETGNLPGATASFSEALDVARRLGDALIEAPVWNNLGIALFNAAQYADALQCFERAIQLASDSDAFASVRMQALSNISTCAHHLQDTRRGIAAAQRAIELNPDPTSVSDCLSRVGAESVYARLLLDVGALKEATDHCDRARLYAARAPSARADFYAERTSALVDIHANRPDIGLTRLKHVLEHARKDLRSEVRDVLSACIAGYEAAGQPDVALIYLHELLALNKQSKAAQVLMHHQQHLQTLEQQAGADTIDHTLAWHQGQLRTQLGERELIRNRMLLLEQQSIAAELHDDTTGEHCYRVGRLAAILGREIGLEDDVCFLLDLAARLHDIGKLVVPDAILLKPGKLTEGEREIMQTHTTAGADILAKSNVPQMHIAEEIARHHHERWDGTGYPMKLAGNAIPIAARVSALADVFDALTHVRPYKKAWPVADALAEIRSLRGKQFDPELTDVFLELVPRLQREVGDLDAFLAVEAKNSPFIQARKQIAAALKGADPSTTLFDLRR